MLQYFLNQKGQQMSNSNRIISHQQDEDYGQNRASSAYMSLLKCCGNICGTLCCSYKQIKTSEIGLQEEFGKYVKNCKTGLNYFNPITENIKQISLSTKVVDMAKQSVYTKDNMSVLIDTAVFYRIVDPYKATYIVKDVLASIIELTFVTLRVVCGEYSLQQLLINRMEVNEKVEHFVREQSENWGVYIDHLLLKDMILSKYLQSNLSKVPMTKRAVESKIISAKADLQSAKLYRQAADILDIKAAMQIRFLETLENMNNMSSKKTLIMPLHTSYD